MHGLTRFRQHGQRVGRLGELRRPPGRGPVNVRRGQAVAGGALPEAHPRRGAERRPGGGEAQSQAASASAAAALTRGVGSEGEKIGGPWFPFTFRGLTHETNFLRHVGFAPVLVSTDLCDSLLQFCNGRLRVRSSRCLPLPVALDRRRVLPGNLALHGPALLLRACSCSVNALAYRSEYQSRDTHDSACRQAGPRTTAGTPWPRQLASGKSLTRARIG